MAEVNECTGQGEAAVSVGDSFIPVNHPEPSLLRAYWAHFTLKGLDLTISHFPPDTVDVFIHVGQSRLT